MLGLCDSNMLGGIQNFLLIHSSLGSDFKLECLRKYESFHLGEFTSNHTSLYKVIDMVDDGNSSPLQLCTCSTFILNVSPIMVFF